MREVDNRGLLCKSKNAFAAHTPFHQMYLKSASPERHCYNTAKQTRHCTLTQYRNSGSLRRASSRRRTYFICSSRCSFFLSIFVLLFLQRDEKLKGFSSSRTRVSGATSERVLCCYKNTSTLRHHHNPFASHFFWVSSKML